jgi:NADH pyrophosphatase NudC (nudix superfamily)
MTIHLAFILYHFSDPSLTDIYIFIYVEIQKDDALNAQHSVEEAMTNALLRDCHKCSTRFFKEEGCNKMTCPKCRAVMCYVCKL